MFTFDRETGGLLFSGDPALSLPSPSFYANLAGEGEILLSLRETAEAHTPRGRETLLSYSDEAGEITARLTLLSRKDCLSVTARAQVYNMTGYHRQRQLSPRGSLRLVFPRIPGLRGMLAISRHKVWWTRPAFVRDPSDLPPQTQGALCGLPEGWLYLLPVCGDDCRTDLAGTPEGLSVLISTLEEGHDRLDTPALVMAAGPDPFPLPERATREGMSLRGGGLLRREKRYPAPLEYLGYCSWDAFYSDVSEQGLAQKLEELRELGLPVRWLMIDDGWSSVEDKKLLSFDAQEEKFPHGLPGAVRRLKEEYGIRWVGAWQNIAGYWEGVHPKGEVFAGCREWLHPTRKGRYLPAPTEGASFAFWHAWHSRLEKAGIDLVKVDNQSSLDGYFGGEHSAARIARAVHAGLEGSVSLHFGGDMINCMGMATESVWNRPLTSVSRSSNDFLPKILDGFGEHALQNAYNSYWQGPFYWSDFDMFWTSHLDSVPHLLLRAISGGPVYFSDPVGGTDPSRLWPLILSDGRVLRCDGVGLPTADMLLTDPQKTPVPLKLWNTAGEAGVLAAFHAFSGEKPVTGTLSPSDVPGLSGGRFAVFDSLNQTLRVMEAQERLPVTLAPLEARLLALVPIHGPFAAVGLAEKLLAPLTVESVEAGEGRRTVRLREGGTFLFFSEQPPVSVLADGRPVPFKPFPGCPGGWRADCASETVIELLY